MTQNKDWLLDAPCTQFDPEMWFPSGGKFTAANRFALEMCRACPVKRECLESTEGLLCEDDRGISGGMAARERRKMRADAGRQVE